MRTGVFAPRRHQPADRCEHCGDLVDRVWLVPGDVLNSCGACYLLGTGRAPVHDQGHSSSPAVLPPAPGRAASFHLRADHKRPA